MILSRFPLPTSYPNASFDFILKTSVGKKLTGFLTPPKLIVKEPLSTFPFAISLKLYFVYSVVFSKFGEFDENSSNGLLMKVI